MAEWPGYYRPAPPVLTTGHAQLAGMGAISVSQSCLGFATSATWDSANRAYFYPFHLNSWETAYQLLFWVGATSSGNVCVAIYDSQKNRVVTSGSTGMSATVNTVQELNITDTTLPPGDYLIAAACDNTTGTCFRMNSIADELTLPSFPVYEQSGLTAATLTDPGVPVVCTQATIVSYIFGIQFRSVF